METQGQKISKAKNADRAEENKRKITRMRTRKSRTKRKSKRKRSVIFSGGETKKQKLL